MATESWNIPNKIIIITCAVTWYIPYFVTTSIYACIFIRHFCGEVQLFDYVQLYNTMGKCARVICVIQSIYGTPVYRHASMYATLYICATPRESIIYACIMEHWHELRSHKWDTGNIILLYFQDRGDLVRQETISNISKMLRLTPWILYRFVYFPDPCLLVILWRNRQTDFHETFMKCQAQQKK